MVRDVKHLTRRSRGWPVVFRPGFSVLLLPVASFAFLKTGCTPAEMQLAGLLNPNFQPTLDVRLRATSTEVQILAGEMTRALTYEPEFISGDASNVANLPGSYLGPIIRARTGDRVRVRLENELQEPTIIHWHGLRVPDDMDGHPRFAIQPGKEFVYEFEVLDRAGTYWFHPHAHETTGPQVYGGLAGLFLVSDAEEDAADLPSGEFDVPLIIQDRSFDSSNQFVYAPRTGMMNDGVLGDEMVVNGQANFELTVATRAYRLRLLNGSNSRIYKLAWNDGTPLQVIATDGGFLETPITRDYVTLAPGERVELWADFSKYAVGTDVTLQSMAFEGADVGMDGMMGGDEQQGGMMGMMGMGDMSTMAAMSSMPNGAEFDVMRVRVERAESESRSLPQRLSTLARQRVEDASNAASPRTIAVSMLMNMGMGSDMGMRWGLNGRTFDMNDVAPDEVIKLDDLEVWKLVNETTPMAMNHPLHIHGAQFQIIERSVMPDFSAGWESVRRGYVDEGWKDTVLLMPGERIKLLIRFTDFAGTYVYHCHNLEHADAGMMRNLKVEP